MNQWKKYLLVTILVLSAWTGYTLLKSSPHISVESGPEEENVPTCLEKLENFEEFEQFDSSSAEVDFTTNEKAATFRTVITNSVAKGPNFAGHYNITTWGCGTDCFGYAVVDVRNGEIIDYSPVHENYKHRPSEGMTNLFIIDPVNAGDERSFYSIVDGKFTKVCSEISDRDLYGEIIE